MSGSRHQKTDITETEITLRESIKENLLNIKNAIDDYLMTPDSVDFLNETAALENNLLKLALKFHILIGGGGSKELIHASKQQDPAFAKELTSLLKIHEKGGEKYQTSLSELATEIAAEYITTHDTLRTYRLSQAKLDQLAEATMKRVAEITNTLKKEILETASIKSSTNPPMLARRNASRGIFFQPSQTTSHEVNETNESTKPKPGDKS